ncbi:hypothetical protein D3C77_405240 [compost metagenome]
MLNKRNSEAFGGVQNVENLITPPALRVLLHPAHALEPLDLIVDKAPKVYITNRTVKLAGISVPKAANRESLEISILEQLEDTPV